MVVAFEDIAADLPSLSVYLAHYEMSCLRHMPAGGVSGWLAIDHRHEDAIKSQRIKRCIGLKTRTSRSIGMDSGIRRKSFN